MLVPSGPQEATGSVKAVEGRGFRRSIDLQPVFLERELTSQKQLDSYTLSKLGNKSVAPRFSVCFGVKSEVATPSIAQAPSPMMKTL